MVVLTVSSEDLMKDGMIRWDASDEVLKTPAEMKKIGLKVLYIDSHTLLLNIIAQATSSTGSHQVPPSWDDRCGRVSAVRGRQFLSVSHLLRSHVEQ